MKFRVYLGCIMSYMFDSADEAVRFAITAKVKRESTDNEVHIYLISDSDLEAERLEEDAADD